MAREMRGLGLGVVLGLVTTTAFAVPALQRVMDLTQPDGTSFRGRQWGDERSHGYETADGYTIQRDPSTRYWHYVQADGKGHVRPVAARPGIEQVPAGLMRGERPSHVVAAPRPVGPSRVSGWAPVAVSEPPQRAVPSTGTGYMPVVLVSFSDRSPTYSKTSFNTLLFTGTKSMADYYQEVSYDAFTVSAGPGGIAGWYTASHTHNHYGENDTNPQDPSDLWPGDLVYEAAAAADAAGFNFAPYDQDGDCYVDNLVVIHQGTGEEVGLDDYDIWSHSWDLNSAQYYGRSHYPALVTSSTCASNPSLKVKVSKYTVQPELYYASYMTSIGVFAHEFGHALGLPDLYDTDGSSWGAGDWTIMAGGSWNYVTQPGDSPAHFGPWEKWRLGWITPTPISCSASVNIPTASTSSTGFYRLLDGSAPGGTGEYFLVENRQSSSAAGFDDGLPGNGLLIWHVDEATSNNTKECWQGSSTPPPVCSASVHYKVAVIQADNQWNLEKKTSNNNGDSGDPYPGSTSKTTFNNTSTPSSKLYSGAASGASVTSISSSAATMTATLTAPGSSFLAVSKVGSGTGSVSSTPAGISCGGTCSASFSCGTPVSLSPMPGTGSSFAGWSGDCSGTGACSVTMDGARNVTATFNLNTYLLTVSTAGSGTVTSVPAGISCGSDCSESYTYNTGVTLTATPAAGSVFSGWSGACGGTGQCVLSMTSARSVTATFVPLTISIDDGSTTEGDSGTTSMTVTVTVGP
jgi:immune inhibitor A